MDVRENVPGLGSESEPVKSFYNNEGNNDDVCADDGDGNSNSFNSKDENRIFKPGTTDRNGSEVHCNAYSSNGNGSNNAQYKIDSDNGITNDVNDGNNNTKYAASITSNIDTSMLQDDWTADELLSKFKGGLMTSGGGTNGIWSLKPRIPLGHTVMIANSKDDFNRKITKGGKPIMDYLASSLIKMLLSSTAADND